MPWSLSSQPVLPKRNLAQLASPGQRNQSSLAATALGALHRTC